MNTERIVVSTHDGLELEAEFSWSGDPTKAILLAHGITVDLNEGGMFARLVDRLADDGWSCLRFSFRGHGGSQGSQRGVTVAGEVIDLECALQALIDRTGLNRVCVLASSFGAVSTGILLPALVRRNVLDRLVLWNPVLDVSGTFVGGRTPWAAENFTSHALEKLLTDGFMLLDGSFEVGYSLSREMATVDARSDYAGLEVPTLIVHGDLDQSVSYAESEQMATRMAVAELATVEGSDHGFSGADYEDQAIGVTREWLSRA